MTAKREGIRKRLDALLVSCWLEDDWSDLNKLSRAAQIYQPTEILKSEMATNFRGQGEVKMKKVLVTGATGFVRVCC